MYDKKDPHIPLIKPNAAITSCGFHEKQILQEKSSGCQRLLLVRVVLWTEFLVLGVCSVLITCCTLPTS